MKKTMIALAVAAALPVAAQADVTLSGSIKGVWTLGGADNGKPALTTKFAASSSEVLANGMTATASFDILGGGSQGTVGLSGDFGSVTAGSGQASDLTDTDANDSITMSGVSYSGTFAALSVNAAAGEYNGKGAVGAAGANADYNTYGASYDLDGITIAASNTNDVTSISATYTLGDITLTADKDSNDENATIKAAYSATMGDLAVTLSAQTGANAADVDTWDMTATYTMGDIALTVKDSEAANDTKISAKYVSGAVSLTVDDDSDVTVAYDMGNADIAIERDSSVAAGSTKVTYTVAF
jgi:predicted porin